MARRTENKPIRSLRDEKKPTTAKYAPDAEQYLAALAILSVRSRCGIYISPPSATSGIKVRVYGPDENLETYCAFDESAAEEYGQLVAELLSDTHEATLHQLAAAFATVLAAKAPSRRKTSGGTGEEASVAPEAS